MKIGKIRKSIKKSIRSKNYQITGQALVEISENFLSLSDVEHALENAIELNEIIEASFMEDYKLGVYQPDSFYLIGPSESGRSEVHVYCRLLDTGKVRITEVSAKG